LVNNPGSAALCVSFFLSFAYYFILRNSSSFFYSASDNPGTAVLISTNSFGGAATGVGYTGGAYTGSAATFYSSYG
jgi:hypothetical protein